MFCLCLFCS
uniref:Uncharacterized protein n=1 Tax=Rhizophora mucronata TaxID=61149 RepID=A0A2P2J3J2_RHIMU